MPLLLPLTIPFGVILGAFILLGLLRTQSQWQRPTMAPAFGAVKTKAKPSGFWGWTKAFFTGRALEAGLPILKTKVGAVLSKAWTHIEHWTIGLLGHALAGTIRPATAWVNSLSQLAWRVPASTAALAEATYNALSTLRNVTVPTLIHNALVPVTKTLNDVKAVATLTRTQFVAGTTAIAHDLTSINWNTASVPDRALINFGDAFVNLWKYTRGTLTQTVNGVVNVTIPALRRQITAVADDLWDVINVGLPDLRARTKRLEDQLRDLANSLGGILGEIPTAAALAAAAVAAVTAAAPYLFCRNSRRVGETVCGMDERMLDELLSIATGAVILANLEEYVKLAQAVARETAEGIQEIL